MKKSRKKKPTRKKKKNGLLSRMAVLSLLLGFFVLLADQVTKYLVHSNIPRMTHESQWYPYKGIGIFENFLGIEFSIVHATNRGAAWGLFSDFQDYLFAFRIIFILALIVYLVGYNKSKELTLPLTLIVVGAIGNIIDYFVYGHVVDMLHFVFWGYDYPVFNVADSTIFIGVCSVIILTIRNQNKTLFSRA